MLGLSVTTHLTKQDGVTLSLSVTTYLTKQDSVLLVLVSPLT